MIRINILLILFALIGNLHSSNYKVALCITATGKYSAFALNLITSAKTFFLKDCDVTYFVFTDQPVPSSNDTKIIYQQRLGWPYDTLMRFEIYLSHAHLFEDYDYIFASDADMLFVAEVGHEILRDLVGTIHPGYYNKKGTYETRKRSTACVKKREAIHYFAGGFYGGRKDNVLHLLKTTSTNIRKDLDNNLIAIWHDESHLNRYFIDYKPSLCLDPSYCYPENCHLPFPKKLLALDKNHGELRQ